MFNVFAPPRILLALAGTAFLAGCATPPPAAPAAPQATAAKAATAVPERHALVNPGFESLSTSPRGDPEGWFSFQHAGPSSYRYSFDTENPHGGTRSLRIENIGPEPFGAIAQIVDARRLGGTTARLSAWMRTRDASDAGAGLTLLTQRSGATVAQNFMTDGLVKGTTGWIRYTITLPIEPGVSRLEVGAMLQGKGSLWLDDVELEFLRN